MANPSVEQELIELERQFWQAMKDRDASTAVRLSDDTTIVAGPQGVASIDKSAIRGIVDDAKYTLDEFDLHDAEVRLISDDVAIIAYGVHEKLTVDGQPVELDAADSSTWVRRDGTWVCAMHSEAIAGDPFGRDRQNGTA